MANEKDHGPRLGADPELFVQTTDGIVVPVCGKVGGTKENPLNINHLIDAHYGPEGGRRRRLGEPDYFGREGNYAVQEDNVMLEFNIPAYRDSSYFMEAITKVLNVLETEILQQRGIQLKHEVMHTFKAEDLEAFPQAMTVGCLSDMNAYSETGAFEREPFTAAHFGNNRFCGGHLHVQYNHGNVPRHIFAQFMDLMVELPHIRWDRQKMRRMFYGQPGIYREKPYGIEYRTPSNFWLTRSFREKHLGQMVENVYALAKTANTHPDKLQEAYGKIDWSDVQHAIKTEDPKLADEIIEFVRLKIGLYMGLPAQR